MPMVLHNQPHKAPTQIIGKCFQSQMQSPKKKKRCLVFQKLNFLCFLLTIFPQNQLLKYFRQTHYHQEPSRIQNKITQMHTIDLPKPLTCNKQLHKFISTQEEEFLSTNYSFVVFCLQWNETLSIRSSSKVFSFDSFSSHIVMTL